MRPIRILGIAPYESMRGLMLSIAETMPDVAIPLTLAIWNPALPLRSSTLRRISTSSSPAAARRS